MQCGNTKTFCCCIPSRLGVLILSPITAILAGLLSYVQLFLLINYAHNSSTLFKVVHCVYAAVVLLVAIGSVAGLIGSVFASRSLVSFYSRALLVFLLAFIASSALSIWLQYNQKNQFINECVNKSNSDLDSLFVSTTSGTRQHQCQEIWKIITIVTIVLVSVTLVFLIYLFSIVSRYRKQLAEKQMYQYVKHSQLYNTAPPPPLPPLDDEYVTSKVAPHGFSSHHHQPLSPHHSLEHVETIDDDDLYKYDPYHPPSRHSYQYSASSLVDPKMVNHVSS